MKLFGFNITKQNRSDKLLRHMVPDWFWGKEWLNRTDQQSLINAYRSWVYVAVARNAATFAATPLRLFAAIPEKTTKLLAPTKRLKTKQQDWLFAKYADLPQVRKAAAIVEIVQHPYIDLVTSVNPFINKSDLLEIKDIHEELTGDAYWYLMPGMIKNKEGMSIPHQIWPLNPAQMRIVPDPVKFISHYVYRVSPGIGFSSKFVRFEVDEIIHFKLPNPNDPYYGYSPLSAVAEMYNINMNMNTFENALFTNNARQEGFFTTEDDIDDDAFERLKSELLEGLQGPSNAGKTMLLDKGVKWEKTGFSPRDLSFERGRKWPKSEIFEAFNTPLGLYDPNSTEANAKSALLVYAKYGISPRHRRTEEKLNEQLMPRYDVKLFTAFDNVVPEDNEFKLKEDTELLKVNARTVNEVRQRRGDEPVEWGDKPLMPLAPAFGGSSEEEIEEAISGISEKIVAQLAS